MEERSEHDDGVPVAKRRRIEKLGEAYLRGEGLFILSAGIRGPLGAGWVNPWKRKKKREGVLGSQGEEVGTAEVPETVQRGVGEKLDGGEEQDLESAKSTAKRTLDHVREAKEVEDARKRQLQQDPFVANTSATGSKRATKEPHGQNWLKKDLSAFPSDRITHTEDIRLQQASPSSRIRPPRLAKRTVPLKAEHDQPTRPDTVDTDSSNGRVGEAMKLAEGQGPPELPSPRRGESGEDEEEKQSQTTSRVAESFAGVEPIKSPGHHSAEDRAQNESVEQTRAGAERIGAQELPSPTAEGTPRRPDFLQHRGISTSDKRAGLVLPATAQLDPGPKSSNRSWNGSRSAQSKQRLETQGPSQAYHANRNMPPPPTLSREASSTTVVSVMPSAQVAATVQVPAANESLPSTGDKLSERAHEHSHEEEGNSFQSSTQAAIAAAQLQLRQEFVTPRALKAAPDAAPYPNINLSAKKARSKGGITPFSAFNKANPVFTTDNALNTQEMLDAITPFHLTTTVKKGPLKNPPTSESPLISTQAKAKKSSLDGGKGASFGSGTLTSRSHSGSGSSQGSVKSSWKVSKHGAERPKDKTDGHAGAGVDVGVGVPADSSGSYEFGKLSLDMATSEEENGTNMVMVTGKDKSTMMTMTNTTTASTTISSKKTTTSAAAQDAQAMVTTPKAPILGPISRAAGSTDDRKEEACEAGCRRGEGEDGVEAEPAHHRHRHHPENFDLSAAMDEVGSFLQSWDTDREAREMKMMDSQMRKE